MADQDVLVHTMVELADTLVEDFDVVDLLTLLTDRCVEVFDVQDAGLMLAAPMGGELRVMSSSSVVMRDLELIELQADDGPCVEAYRSGEAILNQDLADVEERWPRFTPAAAAAGFGSVSAIPMRLRGATIGALNLLRTARAPLGAVELSAARAMVDVATIAVLQHQASVDAQVLNAQLNSALDSRVLLEQAKGMLAERAGIEVDEAFAWLRSHARNRNLRLSTLAQDVLDGKVSDREIEPAGRTAP